MTVTCRAPTLWKFGFWQVKVNLTVAVDVTALGAHEPMVGVTVKPAPKPAPTMEYDVGTLTAYSHVGTEAISIMGFTV